MDMAIYATSRKKKHNFLLPVLITVILALVILSAVWLTKTIVTNQLQENNTVSPAAAAGNPTVTASAPPVQKVTFTENSMLNMTYLYSCGHTMSKVEKVPPEFIGKTLDEVREAFPEYDITSFSPGTSNAEKKLSSVCDEHYIMKLDGEKLLITYKNNPHKVKQEMPIDINMLPFETIEILNKGISVDGETELLEFMEDFAS